MEAKPIVRPSTLAKLRRGTHDLELSLCVLPEFPPNRGPPELRYSLLASLHDGRAFLRAYEKHIITHVRNRDHDAEGRARAQMLRAAATAFLDYASPCAAQTTSDLGPWPYSAWGYNRDPFLPRFFRWEETERGSDLGWFEPVFETKRVLDEAAPILISELGSYFAVEYAVASKKQEPAPLAKQ